jgi:hypothetical protein
MLDKSKIIKRLELIKNLISLEEESGIITHTSKINEMNPDQELETILALIENKNFSKAMTAIENYINKFNHLQFYTDPEIQGLKLEAKSLEVEINKLSNEKADLDKLIHEFGVRHSIILPEIQTSGVVNSFRNLTISNEKELTQKIRTSLQSKSSS